VRDEVDPPKSWDPPWRGRTAHRSSTPEAMHALRWGRLAQGWTQEQAAWHSGVSRPMINQLERGVRRPSKSLAEALIAAYRLRGAAAAAVRAVAVPLAGRDSPYRTGLWPHPGRWEHGPRSRAGLGG
jgi:DNA-binding XRE family transcriptional regulator